MSAVINQGIHSFLKHSFFITNNNIWGFQFQHSLQTVISINHTSIQIIQVRSCITSTVKHHHRAQIRRNDRHNIQNHPSRFIARLEKCFYDFQPFQNFDFFLTIGQPFQFILEIICCILEIIDPMFFPDFFIFRISRIKISIK